jgi:hypothetical protein
VSFKSLYRFRNDSGRLMRLDLDAGPVELEPGADIDIPAGYALPTPGAGNMVRASVVSNLWPGLNPVEPLPTYTDYEGRVQPVLYRTPTPQRGKNQRPAVQRIAAPSARQMAAEVAAKEAVKGRAQVAQAKADAAKASGE